MSEIDWSKAPEGATHRVSGFIDEWRKKNDCNWSAWYEGKWWPIIDPTPNMYIPRPASEPWSGEGLPPVGAVCEYRWGGVCKQVEIIAHWMAPADLVAVYVPLEDGAHSTECGRAIANAFRPLRTPEQIAAEAREKDAQSLFELINPEGKWHKFHEEGKAGYRAAIDAGYRKVEGGAK